jgi:hypothetical protein
MTPPSLGTSRGSGKDQGAGALAERDFLPFEIQMAALQKKHRGIGVIHISSISFLLEKQQHCLLWLLGSQSLEIKN